MTGVEDELIVALTRLKEMLEQQPPGEVLPRLVHRRRLMELSREALALQTHYTTEATQGDPRKSTRIAELGAEVERLQGSRA